MARIFIRMGSDSNGSIYSNLMESMCESVIREVMVLSTI